MAVKPMVFASQIELPIDADHEKSPIRQRELVAHINSEKHIQNDGLPNQMLVMTAAGPRMMTPKVQCSGVDELRYSCDCRVVFDDNPPLIPDDVTIHCYQNGLTEVPNEGTIRNIPAWTLRYDNESTFYRFVPEKVFDCDLSRLTWHMIDNIATNLTGILRLIEGRMCYDVHFDMSGIVPFDDYLVTGIGGQSMTNMMRIRITR